MRSRRTRIALLGALALLVTATATPAAAGPGKWLGKKIRHNIDRRFKELVQKRFGPNQQHAVREHLDKMGGTFNRPLTCFVDNVLLRPMLRRLFDAVQISGVDHVIGNRDKPLILLSNHRSHFDYGLKFSLFRGLGLPLFQVAGVNLSKMPFFRYCGAAYIGRSRHKARSVPVATEQAYFGELTAVGTEFNRIVNLYPEGTRSPTGKQLQPRTGVLADMLEPFFSGTLDDVLVAQANVDYERVLDDGMHADKLVGKPKPKETLGEILKHAGALWRLFQRKHGRVYLQFLEPVSVAALADKWKLDPRKEPNRRQEFVERLADHVSKRLDRASVVTPHDLVASALLDDAAKGPEGEVVLDRPQIQRRVETYLERLKSAYRPKVQLGDGLTGDAAHLARSIDRALQSFIENGWIGAEGGQPARYLLTTDQRPRLDYYKNHAISKLVTEALTALALLARPGGTSFSRLTEAYETYQGLFEREFFGDGRKAKAVVTDTLASFVEAGWIERQGKQQYGPTEQGPQQLRRFARLLRPYLEAYDTALQRLQRDAGRSKGLARQKKAQKFVKDDVLDFGMQRAERGEVSRESVSTFTYANAVQHLSSKKMAGQHAAQRALIAEALRSLH